LGTSFIFLKLDDLDLENIGYIHCDAQGAEPFIFSCGKQFIKKHRPIILYEDSESNSDTESSTSDSAVSA
jgi:hypothetical protein